MKRRWPLSVAALGTGVVVLAGPALAYFSVDGTGNSGFAQAGALGTPVVTATRFLGVPTFKVAHTPPGVPPQGYDVNTGNENDVCTIHGTTGTCTPLGIYAGKQTFHIRSFVRQWVGPLVTCTFGPGDLVAACGGGSGGGGGIGISLDVSTPILEISDDLGISSSDGITNKTKVTLVGTGPIGATVTIFDAGVEIGHGVVDGTGRYAIAVTLAEGTHSITAQARTVADIGPVSAAGIIKIDLTAPLLSVKLDATALGFRVTGTAGVLTGDVASVHLAADNGSSVPSTEPVASGKFGADVQAATGTTLVTVTQVDVAGNTTMRSVTIHKAQDPAPPATTTSTPPPSTTTSTPPPSTTTSTPPPSDSPSDKGTGSDKGDTKSDPGTTKSDPPSTDTPASTPPASTDDKPATPAADNGTGTATGTPSGDPTPAADKPAGDTPAP